MRFIIINYLDDFLKNIISEFTFINSSKKNETKLKEEIESDIEDLKEQIATVDSLLESQDEWSDEDIEEYALDNGWDDFKSGERFGKGDLKPTKEYLKGELEQLEETLEKEDSDNDTIVPDETTPRPTRPNSPPSDESPTETSEDESPTETSEEKPPAETSTDNSSKVTCVVVIFISYVFEFINEIILLNIM